MGSVGDQIRAARKARGMTQAALANAVGVTQGALTKWELGQNEPSLDKLARLSEVLGAPLGAIPIENIPSPPPLPPVEAVAVTRRIPVVGMAAAAMYDPALSQLCDLWEGSEETVPCVIDREGIFALRVQGDSMEPDLHDGDVVAVDPNTLPATGDTAIVCLRAEGLVIKRWHWKRGVIRLESLNPEGKTYQWTKDEVFRQGPILWRWKVLGILWRKL